MKQVLVDTGPLVALLSRADQYHEPCVEALRALPAPLSTCWPVLTEAASLLRSHPAAIDRLLTSLTAGFLRLLPLDNADAEAIAGILRQYRTIRPQLADAALVHLARRERIDTVFTLDQRDFSVYRGFRQRPFHILPELR